MRLSIPVPKSIYSRTMLLVGGVTMFLQIFSLSIFFNQVMLPNIYKNVNYFVDELVMVTGYPSLLQDMVGREDELGGFIRGDLEVEIKPAQWRIPFWYFVDRELERRFGRQITMLESHDSDASHSRDHYWVDLPVVADGFDIDDGEIVRIGFSADRESCLNPPVLLLVLSLVVSISMISVYYLSRWLVKPINELRGAVGEMAMGEYPKPLQEKGPTELLSLVQLFNWMVRSVRSLTENRSTILSGISHDLKTPLARMRLSVEMLSKKDDAELVEGIVDDLDVMDLMIKKSLEFARGEQKGKQEQVDITGVVTDVVGRKIRGGMRVSWEPSSTPCERMIDSSALHRILSNYLDNGWRYGGRDGVEIRIECPRGDQGPVRIEVLDRGEGISKRYLERVFRPFYRLDKSRSSHGGGSGLGLAIVKNLADANGWRVALENRAGGGVAASLEIP